jgi:autotransporter-associated beta strand protein
MFSSTLCNGINAMKTRTVNFAGVISFVVIIILLGPQRNFAASLFWIGNPGGGGAWDTTLLNWQTGANFVAWNNSNNDDAVFQTAGGSVSIDTPINVHNMSVRANNYYFNGNPITLSGVLPTISVDAGISTSINTTVSGSDGLVKDGSGALILNYYSDYTGQTKVAEGILGLAYYSSLPGGWNSSGGTSNLNIAGGVVEFDFNNSPNTFARGLGTGPSQVQFTSSGGFFANSNSWTVNLGGTGAPLMWGSGGFVPNGETLILGSTSNYTIEFKNPMQLGGINRTVLVPNGIANISGPLAGAAGPRKTGAGILSLTNYNYYTGTTVVAEGILRLSHPYALPGGIDATGGWDNLNLAGGIVEFGSHSTVFSRPVGTGTGQVQFTGSGGFSAFGNDVVVNFGGASEAVTWASGGFVPDGSSLILGSSTATGTVDLQNSINLGSALRTVQVNRGSANIDAKLSNTLIGIGGGLNKSGDGILELASANTYNGETRVSMGVLRLSDALALPGGFGTTGGTSNLNLNGGVLEWTGDLLRGLGAGPSQVRFTGSAALRPLGTNCTINFGGSSQTLYWASGGFILDGNAFILDATNASIEFQNSIDLNNSTRTIQIDGDPLNRVRFNNSISGNGGLIKTGTGCLDLATANAYSGETKISQGFLRLSHLNAVPGGCGTTGGTSNLNIEDGVVELAAGDLLRPIGTGPTQVQFHSGGFAALGANRIVNFGGASSGVIWGSANFLNNSNSLVLSSVSSTATLDFQNPIDLDLPSRTVIVENGSAVVDAKISGSISGVGGFEKTGEGLLELSAANFYNGATTVSGGILRISNAQAIPGGVGARGGTSNLVLNYSVLELASDNFYRSVGTGPDQVQFPYVNGGFSAFGANRIVNIGGASAPFTLSNSFTYYTNFFLSSPTSNATLDFQNPIVLVPFWWYTPIIDVANGSAAIDAKLSGGLSGTSDFIKYGEGTLELTATSSYTGTTYVDAGVLRISHAQAIPGGIGATGGTSNLALMSGVLELANGNFYRALGTGPDQVRFDYFTGGFSAFGANRIVNFGGASAQIDWYHSSFVGNNDLILSSSSADATVILQNPINLDNNNSRSVRVENGAAVVDAILSGIISGVNSSFTKKGPGTLVFSAANTYSGHTVIQGGCLIFEAGIAENGTQFIDIQAGNAIFSNVEIHDDSLTINTDGDGVFLVSDSVHGVGNVQGNGRTELGSDATLTVTSICQSSLKIGPGSRLILRPYSSEPLGDEFVSIPEPSVWILIISAFLSVCLTGRWIGKKK